MSIHGGMAIVGSAKSFLVWYPSNSTVFALRPRAFSMTKTAGFGDLSSVIRWHELSGYCIHSFKLWSSEVTPLNPRCAQKRKDRDEVRACTEKESHGVASSQQSYVYTVYISAEWDAQIKFDHRTIVPTPETGWGARVRRRWTSLPRGHREPRVSCSKLLSSCPHGLDSCHDSEYRLEWCNDRTSISQNLSKEILSLDSSSTSRYNKLKPNFQYLDNV